MTTGRINQISSEQSSLVAIALDSNLIRTFVAKRES